MYCPLGSTCFYSSMKRAYNEELGFRCLDCRHPEFNESENKYFFIAIFQSSPYKECLEVAYVSDDLKSSAVDLLCHLQCLKIKSKKKCKLARRTKSRGREEIQRR